MSAPVLVTGHIVAGKYAVRTLLRTDGAVATYHAITAPSRDVALKLFDPRLLLDPTAVEDRERVVKAAAALPESLVLPILEQGIDAETTAPFVATSLSAHPSLAQLVLLCPLSLVETATVMRSIGRALEQASHKGLFHHALKPTNVFVGPPTTYATHLVDFGATAARRALAARSVGTLRVTWLAPEQLEHEGDARTDVFAAALVAFFAMTGRSFWRCAPAEGEPQMAAWRAEIDESRADASARGAELGKPVERAIDAILARALAIDPAERFASVIEFTEAFAVAAGLAQAAPLPQSVEVLPSIVPTSQAFSPISASRFRAAAPVDTPPPAPLALPSIPPAPPIAAAAPLDFVPAPPPPVLPVVAAVAPSEPPPDLPRRRTFGIVVAIVAVIAVGGGAIAFALTRPGGGPVAASSTAVASSAAPATSNAIAIGPDIDAGALEDAAIAAAAPDAAALRDRADITIVCKPACASVRIDGQVVDDVTAPTFVVAGAHTVTAAAPTGFLPQTKRVTVKRGEHAKVTVVLSSARAAGPGPAAPCGKFLKRCN